MLRKTNPLTDPNEASLGAYQLEGTLQRRVLTAFGANTLSQVIRLLNRLILPPLYLRAWGAHVYGEWLLITTSVFYLTLADFGLGQYLSVRLTETLSHGNEREFRRVWQTALLLFLFIAGAVFVAAGGWLALFGNQVASRLSGVQENQFAVLMVILVSLQISVIFQGLFLAVYRAVGVLHLGVMLANLTEALQVALMALALWFRADIGLVAAVQLIPMGLISIYSAALLARGYPRLCRFSFAEARLREVKLWFRPSLHYLWLQLAQILSLQGMISVVGATMAASDVATFGTLRTMVNVFGTLLGVFTLSTWPEMTRLAAHDKLDKLESLFRIVTRSTLSFAGVLFVFFHTYGAKVYSLWVGNGLSYHPLVMDIFLLYVLQMVFWSAYKQLLIAVRKHEILSAVALASSLLMLALGYWAGKHFGLVGVTAGMLASELVLPFWVAPFLVSRWFPTFTLRRALLEWIPVSLGVALVFLFPRTAPIVLAGFTLWWLESLWREKNIRLSLKRLRGLRRVKVVEESEPPASF